MTLWTTNRLITCVPTYFRDRFSFPTYFSSFNIPQVDDYYSLSLTPMFLVSTTHTFRFELPSIKCFPTGNTNKNYVT